MQQLPLFDAVEIPLTKGYVALVDPVDADLTNCRWCATGKSMQYAVRGYWVNGKHIVEALHRVILERMIGRRLNPGEVADHIDCNTLDNRRENLRLANRSQNNFNKRKRSDSTSDYKGVSKSKSGRKWRALIKANGKSVHLGYFNTPEEAYAAYCEAARGLHGEFARTE